MITNERQLEHKKYKEIKITKEKILAVDNKIIDLFNERINTEHAHLKHNGNSLSVFLRELDILKLEKLIAELSDKDTNKILDEVLKQIKTIKNYGIKSGRRVFVDHKAEKKVKNRAQKEKKRGKHFYANNHSFTTEENCLNREYVNKIICDDSKKVLKQLPNNCIDLIFTSPPYNFGLDYSNGQSDDNYWGDYFDKLFNIFEEGIRVLKYGGRFIVNVQPLYSDYIPIHHIISKYFIEKKMIWKGEIIWEKNHYNCGYCTWGSWKSPSNPYLKGTWEFIEIFCKGTMKKTGDKANIDITKEEFKEWVKSKWTIAPERRMKEFGHPAMFPEKLVERVLKLFSYKNDIILDPFNGVGTTTVVAKKLYRRYLGIDISQKFCNTAQNRANILI